MKKLCLALDLKDDAAAIKEYERLHLPQNERRHITASIRNAGITGMEIYRTGNRLFMIMETLDSFDPAKKQAMDLADQEVVDWETLVGSYQQALPWAEKGEKWMLMKKIYSLPV